VHPDQNRQQLNINVTLVASYQSYQRNPKTQATAPARKAPPAKTAAPLPNPSSLNQPKPKKP
jgi:hypothetical protein